MKEVTIIVNGREKVVEKEKYSFFEIVELAYGQMDQNPNVVYTVSYSKGKQENNGLMVHGDEVKVKEGMVINVSRTDKS